MTEQQATRLQRLAREKTAYRYTTALDNGDLDTIATILQQAERDSELEQMILEIHGAYAAEDGLVSAPIEVEISPFSLPSLPPVPTLPPSSTLPPPARRHRLRLGILARTLAAVLVVGALVGSFLILFAPRFAGSGSSPMQRPITIGLSVSLTGVYFVEGNALVRGYQLWADHVNRNGGLLGRQVRFDVLDDTGRQSVAQANYIKLITEDHVDLLIGPYGDMNAQAAAQAVRYGYALLEGPGVFHSLMTRSFHSHNLFSITSTENQQVNNYLQFLLSLPRSERPKTVAYATSDDPFTQPQVDAVRQQLDRRGFQTALYEVYPAENADPIGPAQRVAAAHADIVLLGTFGLQECVAFIKAFEQVHYTPKVLLAFSGPEQGSVFTRAVGLPATEGVIVPGRGWYPGADTYQNAQFIRDYISKYGGTRNDISLDTVQAYAAGQVLEQAINKIHRIDNTALIQELHTGTFKSIVGSVKFDNTGQNTLAVSYLNQWQQGRLVPVFPPSGAQAKPEYPKALWP